MATAVDIQDVVAASRSDVGGTREDNQDLYGDFRHGTGGRLLVLADGMGGRGGGASASRMCVDAFGEYFRKSGTPAERLVECFEDANAQILEHASRDEKLQGMGTTGVALLFCDEISLVAWVGDSRAYRWRRGTLEALTEDHSLVQEWVRSGVLSEEEAAAHPRRNELMRAVGIGPELEVDVAPVEVEPGDRFLLCSDGLSGVVPHDEICETLGREMPEEAARQLIERAMELGGTDNITVQVAGFGSDLRAASERPVEVEPPVTAQVEAALQRRERRAPALHGSSALFGAGAAIFLAVVGFAYWSRTTLRPAAPLPDPVVAEIPAPPPAELPDPAPAPAPESHAAPPAAAAVPEPDPEPEPPAAEVEPPAEAKPVAQAEPAPVAEPVVQVARAEAPAPSPAPAPAAAPAAPDAASPDDPLAAAYETVEVRRTFEPLAPAAELGLPDEVHAFVSSWLEAAGTADYEAYRALGFPMTDEGFEASYARWEDFRVTQAEVATERSHDGRVYLRVVISYAFHDERGRWRTEDEHRVVLADEGDGLRFVARWR